jgi:monoamine oxidase
MRAAAALFGVHAEAGERGVPADQVLAERREALTRRELIAGGAAIGAGALIAASPAAGLARALTRTAPRIAVVGAGLAGLRCAHLLWTAHPGRPIASTVYDANPDRPGGRCWTLRGYFADGLSTEHGGAFLNGNQTAIRRLVSRLGLTQEIVNGGDLLSGQEVYLIDGAPYTYREASADWEAVGYRVFRSALRDLEGASGQARLDGMSVPEWLDSTPIGTGSRFGKLMLANAVTENGGDPQDMSALDLIEVTGRSRAVLNLPGDDERWHVVGGNDQIVTGMIGELPNGSVRLGHELTALVAEPDGTSRLVMSVAGSTTEVRADIVVLALPFSTLRSVDLSRSGLSSPKREVIGTMGMGSNAKIHVELSRKSWPALGYSGATYSNWDGFCCAWDDSVALGPDAQPALLVGFPGGHVGASGLTGAAHGPAPPADVSWLLGQIERIYPGTTALFTGRAYEDRWAVDPWTLGAYSYMRVGQAATYGAIAGAPEAGVLFAGEHTSVLHQGFLDGAVQSGERAAREVLSRVGAPL